MKTHLLSMIPTIVILMEHSFEIEDNDRQAQLEWDKFLDQLKKWSMG